MIEAISPFVPDGLASQSWHPSKLLRNKPFVLEVTIFISLDHSDGFR